MIKVNGVAIEQNHFPDGSLLARCDLACSQIPVITWKYENDSELFTIMCLKRHLGEADLSLPYVPHARMDRVKHPDEIFTLKYFCDIINSLKFHNVIILDPHSNVTPALLDNVIVCSPESFHEEIFALEEKDKNFVVFFPDEGAMKRYAEEDCIKDKEITFGVKHRDWRTGAITKYSVFDPKVVKGKKVIIIDDICSYGGTFWHAAEALKEAGAEEIVLAITHAENSMVKGKMYNENVIKRIYTTNSLFCEENDTRKKVTII